MTAAVLGGLVVAAAVGLAVIDPARGGVLPGCPFHALTGLYCPGCGSCRALHQLLNGHIGAAVGYNLLTVLALPFLGLSFYRYAAAAISGKTWYDLTVKPAWIWTVLGVVLVFGISRNIHLAPFSWLAP